MVLDFKVSRLGSAVGWTRFAPLFAVLAFVFGVIALVTPNGRGLTELGMAIFSALAAVAAFLMLGAIAKDRREIERLESEAGRVKSQVQRHRDAMDDLADGLDSMIFLLDKEMRILYANHPAKQYFQLEQPRGESLRTATLSSDLADLAESIGDSQEPVSRELTLWHPADRIVQARAWREGYGHSRVFVSLHDVTDLRRLETVRRDFVANVSHELRTPMTTIRAMAETLQDDEDPHIQARYLNKIIREVDRLTRITDDLLTLSIAESGTLQPHRLNFAEIVGTVFSQLERKASEKGLRAHIVRPQELWVMGDDTQLTQIVFNLLDNAINYTAEGDVEVALKDEGSEAVLMVRDTGLGIASEHAPRIFERFYRVDKGRSRATGGTGLGLSIVRHLAELHGGSVSVESELNRGSTFTVRIPKLTDTPR